MRVARLRRALAAVVMGWTAAAFAAPDAEPFVFPFVFPAYTAAAQIDDACRAMLDDLKRGEAGLAAMSPRAGAAGSKAFVDAEVLTALDALHRRAEDTMGPLAVLVAVHPDKSLRDAAEACDRASDAFDSAFRQNAAVYAVLKAIVPADDVDRAFIRHQFDRFDDAGVALAPAGRDRARELDAEISRLGQDFSRRLREDRTRVPFTVDELRGVPEAVWKDEPRDADGRVLLGFDYPTVQPVLERAESAVARERLWRAFNDRGGDANLQTLAQLVERRRDYARLFSHASWADHVLRHRMAQSSAEVQSFLASVQAAVTGFERADLAVLREAKAAHLGTPAEATTLDRWDVPFYSERVRRASFQVDQERFRAYFPPEASLDFVFRLATRLFGVVFAPMAQPPWHADARAFEVRDAADGGRPLGTLFVDLYPRADKYNHAAVWSFRSVSTAAGRLPAVALVVNFNRRGLTLGELETLLHEFGHALHSLLSETRYAADGGTHVKRDFVEAPSQMLEEWVYDPAVLALFQEVCAACAPVPRELLADAERARRFGRGIAVGRQALFAGYDLALYGRDAADPMALWRAMEAATPLGHVPGSRFPAGFGHIAGGYAAGYYGYLWSLVLAEDLRTAFVNPDGSGDWLNGDTGRRYRRAVLARGGEVEPAELVSRFLGRPSDSRAFFRSLDKR